MIDFEKIRRIDEQIRPRPGNGEVPSPRLSVRYGWEAAQPVPLGTIVRGLLYAGSITLFYGPPKSGKSFLVTDLFLAIAAGHASWMGQDIVRHGPVMYVACEGHGGFWKRLRAKALSEGWTRDTFPKDFILVTGRPMLIQLDPDTRAYVPHPDDVLAAIATARARGCDPIAVAVDTVFRSFGSGNVNSSDHMNAYLAALGVIADQGKALVAVHHETKANQSPAGSVSLTGGADVVAHTENGSENGAHFWEVECAKDDAPIARQSFTLKPLDIGTDLDGQLASSCVVVPSQETPKQEKTLSSRKLPPAAALCLRALDIAISKEGAYLPPTPEFPTNTIAVNVEKWKRECYNIKSGSPDLNLKTFNRGQEILVAEFLITQSDGYVWRVKGNRTVAPDSTGQHRTIPDSGT